jgi:hypothetical protein
MQKALLSSDLPTTRALESKTDAQPNKSAPIELESSVLEHVSGGAPNGTWAAVAATTSAPNGTW